MKIILKLLSITTLYSNRVVISLMLSKLVLQLIRPICNSHIVVIYLINRMSILVNQLNHFLKNYFISHNIIINYMSLVIFVILSWSHVTITNLTLNPNLMFFFRYCSTQSVIYFYGLMWSLIIHTIYFFPWSWIDFHGKVDGRQLAFSLRGDDFKTNFLRGIFSNLHMC